MAERPILFSGPMVRAILEGRKTQTRRVLDVERMQKRRGTRDRDGWRPGNVEDPDWRRMAEQYGWCPYGQPGDELWVRETAWYDRKPLTSIGNLERCFFSDGWMRFESGQNGEIPGCVEDNSARLNGNSTLRRRPSIHMPRWASRLQLVIRDVRVQRLKNISEDDAVAEGVTSTLSDLKKLSHLRGEMAARAVPDRIETARDRFAALWDSINSKRAPWSRNPWVWAITFERKV